jgi:serine/threonine-protein kinase
MSSASYRLSGGRGLMNILSSSEPMASVVVGKYRLIALLGEGGAASAFLAVAQGPAGFNKLVVLKVLRRTYAEEPELLELFLDEARIAARLNHPNVVQTYEVASEAGTCFMAMEYLDGQAYSKVLQRGWQKDPLPLAMHLRVLAEGLAGLEYAHTLEDFNGRPLGLVHRDVSPHNIVVTYGGHVKILDFGIAKVVDSNVRTETGVFRGKPAYAAPEQAKGDAFDRRADIYAMGLILWEVLAGRRLRGGGVAAQMVAACTDQDGASPRSVNPDVPEDLERICLRALRRNPDERYPTALEMQQDIEAVLQRLGAPVSAAALGQRVSEMFDKDRAKLRRLIEMQLALGAATPIRLVDDLNPAFVRERPADSAPSPTAPTTTTTTEEPGRSSARHVWLGAAMLAGASISAALAATGLHRPREASAVVSAATSEPRPAVAAPAEATASAPAAAPVGSDMPARSRVAIDAVPPAARLFLDGVALGGNPSEGSVPRDGALHRVRAEASGYTSAERVVVADKDLTVHLTLAAVAGRSEAARPSGPRPGAPPSPRPVEPPSEHTIDPGDPYVK